MIDLETSRRDMFALCKYWLREENPDLIPVSELAYKRIPDGEFYAKEVNSLSIDSQVFGEAFMMRQQNITLKTNDNVSRLKQNDIILYDDHIYRVESIQENKIKKQNQYRMKSSCSSTYFITLKG